MRWGGRCGSFLSPDRACV
ncbi:hypothetical protein A2U01_0092626, partial [Trifolium medium]|nr:hypothetical protein [Trifolium medium]